MTKPWVVIPARGGSVGVPRKNVRMIAGKPLIAHVITTALEVIAKQQIVVITDDDEIEEIAINCSARVIKEPTTASGTKTLDEVIISYLPQLTQMGAVDEDILLVVQPTAPLLEPRRLLEAMDLFAAGAGSVISVKDDRHLTWGELDGKVFAEYSARVNRQLLPARWRETGAIIAAPFGSINLHKTRIVEPIELLKLTEKESLDIDTFADLAVAEHWLTRKKLLFRVDSSTSLGMGHVYRVLALCQVLARHELLVVLSKNQALGKEFFDQFSFNVSSVATEAEFIALASEFAPDVVVLDILDTGKDLVLAIKNAAPATKLVSFEDLGEGAESVDLVVSDLYENPRVDPEKQLTGIEHAILAPSFETIRRIAEVKATVTEILVLFGGSDPSGLATKSLRALEAIGFVGHVTVVRGMGAELLNEKDFKLDISIKQNVKNMAGVMATADLALSSAGRTISELASIGVPVICMAQNQKELMHTHTTADHGVIMLGLGEQVSDASLQREISELVANAELRGSLHTQALAATKNRSNEQIVTKIFSKLFAKS